ncbi:MAG: TraX family protein [Lacrimispora sp.]|nr:TraX family protein [Lacrimispora sp.]MDR7811532.1 TraX family protein [Lacrimispora sp.]
MGIIIYFFRSNAVRLSIIYSSYIFLINIISISNVIPNIRFIIQHYEVVNDIFIIFFDKIVNMNSIWIIEPSLLNLFTFDYQWMMILALPFMILFNHQKGKGYKYFFYIFYPLHLTILYVIANITLYI